jgi:hypothetical protein
VLTWQDNIPTCAKCPFRDRKHKGPNGYTICTVTGREFMEHCRENSCPAGKFAGAPAPDAIPQEVLDARRAVRLPVCGACPELSSAEANRMYVKCNAAPKCCGGGTGTVSLAFGTCPKGRWVSAPSAPTESSS